jgi:hypothetical protein
MTLPTLPVEGAARPEPAGLVQEVRHLGNHAPIAGRDAEDDGVVARQLVHGGDRRGLVELETRFPGDLLGHKLRHALHHRLGPGLSRAFRGGIGHLLHVAVGGIIEH